MTLTDPFVTAYDALPLGTFQGTAYDRRYVVTRTNMAGGRSGKLVAEALDGSDYISLNFYRLAEQPLLKPCEMPAEKVIAFVTDLTVLD